jgi:transketolase
MNKELIDKASDNIRILSAAMVEKANSGHPGGAMGGADFINILYSEFLNFDPDDMSWFLSDRFFLDPGTHVINDVLNPLPDRPFQH